MESVVSIVTLCLVIVVIIILIVLIVKWQQSVTTARKVSKDLMARFKRFCQSFGAC